VESTSGQPRTKEVALCLFLGPAQLHANWFTLLIMILIVDICVAAPASHSLPGACLEVLVTQYSYSRDRVLDFLLVVYSLMNVRGTNFLSEMADRCGQLRVQDQFKCVCQTNSSSEDSFSERVFIGCGRSSSIADVN
jgi:hypothetical protein